MATAETSSLELAHDQLYINQQWVDGSNGDRLDIINPATEEPIANIAYGTAEDARRALQAAQDALPGWQKMTVYDRARKLKRVAELMREKADYLALALTMEQGKPLAEARAETMASADTFEWIAEEGKRAYARMIPPLSLIHI